MGNGDGTEDAAAWSSCSSRAVSDFIDDDCPTMAAALSYYTVFSLPPLLVLLLTCSGPCSTRRTSRASIEGQMRSADGARGGGSRCGPSSPTPTVPGAAGWSDDTRHRGPPARRHRRVRAASGGAQQGLGGGAGSRSRAGSRAILLKRVFCARHGARPRVHAARLAGGERGALRVRRAARRFLPSGLSAPVLSHTRTSVPKRRLDAIRSFIRTSRSRERL